MLPPLPWQLLLVSSIPSLIVCEIGDHFDVCSRNRPRKLGDVSMPWFKWLIQSSLSPRKPVATVPIVAATIVEVCTIVDVWISCRQRNMRDGTTVDKKLVVSKGEARVNFF